MDSHGLQGYAMKPRPGTKFMKRDVEKLMHKLISGKVNGKPYVFEEAQQLSKDLCSDLQAAVDVLGYERYKLIVQCNIAEAASQGLRIASRCLWDPDVDNFAECTVITPTMIVNALVFGLYWE